MTQIIGQHHDHAVGPTGPAAGHESGHDVVVIFQSLGDGENVRGLDADVGHHQHRLIEAVILPPMLALGLAGQRLAAALQGLLTARHGSASLLMHSTSRRRTQGAARLSRIASSAPAMRMNSCFHATGARVSTQRAR